MTSKLLRMYAYTSGSHHHPRHAGKHKKIKQDSVEHAIGRGRDTIYNAGLMHA